MESQQNKFNQGTLGNINGIETCQKSISLPISMGIKSLFSTKPTLDVSVDIPQKLITSSEKVGSLLEDLTTITEKVKEAGIVDKLKYMVTRMQEMSTKVYGAFESFSDTFTSIEMFFEITTTFSSLISLLSNPLSPMSVLHALFSIFKLIKTLVFKLPIAVRAFLGFFTDSKKEEEEEQFYDAVGQAEAGPSVISLGYSALILILPQRIRAVLDSFQRYTRVKILDDFDWLYQVADVVFHVPTFIMTGIEKSLETIPDTFSYKKTLTSQMDQAITKYELLLSFLPEITINRLLKEMNMLITKIHNDRRLLSDRSIVEALKELIDRVDDTMSRIRSTGGTPIAAMQQLFTELNNLYRSGIYLVQLSHPEPVAILLYSPPGVGKTVFVQKCRAYLCGSGKNTIYDYTPTSSSSDFHDQYHDQNVWVHEDIGQRGEQDWAQYIIHIGSNPSRMDGAAVDKKSTIFFRSQVILGTTNIAIHRTGLTPVKNCGWVDPRAIYRRWWVVEFNPTTMSRVFSYDLTTGRWIVDGQIDCTDPKAFCDEVFNMYKENVKSFKNLIQQDTRTADYSFGDAEGRKVMTQLVDKKTEIVEESVKEEQHPRFQTVTFDAKTEVVNFHCEQQKEYLRQGMYINGKKEVVGIGDVHVGSLEGWQQYLANRYAEFKKNTESGITEIFDFMSAAYDVARTQIPKEYWIIGGVFTGLGILMVGALSYYLNSRVPEKPTEEHYEPFLHWAKSTTRMTAAELYAEAGVNLKVESFPSDAVRAIANNVFSAHFSYEAQSIQGHLIAIDADTFITNAHMLLCGSEPPTDVFVKAFDSEKRERLSAYLKVMRWDMDEDLVVLVYKNPHVKVFRSLAKAMSKTPSSKELYLVLPNGVVPLGVPERYEVTSGMYQCRKRLFRSKHGIYHNYDGIATSTPGLCGALVTTLDGYIVGWHVASMHGKGYVRFWNESLKSFIESNQEPPQYVEKLTEVKGASVVDDNTYHHVHLKSGIVPSAMLAPMLNSSLLSNDGIPIRVPAELGGKREVDGETVRTYDHSRTKNLKVPDNVLNMKATAFAKKYVRKLIKSVLPKGKITKMTNEEVVNGYRTDDEQVKKVNLDASAGVPWGGTVKDWVDVEKGTIHEKVLSEMDRIENEAKKKQKNWKDVMFKDCNKDEMRDYEKRQKPRCFAAGPLHYTLLLRRWFGKLQAAFMKNRMRTGIMIGLNATSHEWHEFWKYLIVRPNHFDGDYKEWDGGMRKEVQEALNEVLAELSDNPDIAITLLSFLCETTHVGMDMTYITNHSVPSGHGLTALYNSLINKMYVAYAWYLLVGANTGLSEEAMIVQFEEDIYAPVYGDDIICSVATRIRHLFNAISYSAVMHDIGLGFTSAGKTEHTQQFCNLRDITFLKRKFYASRVFGEIVGPLEISVLKASCGFVHDETRDLEITRQKMNSLQRELYLHDPCVYRQVWTELKRCYYEAFSIQAPELTECEMLKLYKEGEFRYDLFESGVAEAMPGRRKHRRFAIYKTSGINSAFKIN